MDKHILEAQFGWMRKNPTWTKDIQLIDELFAETVQLREDAERYRFVRQDVAGMGVYLMNGNLEVLSLDEADKAIDASRKALNYE